jgi:hypothetical protein
LLAQNWEPPFGEAFHRVLSALKGQQYDHVHTRTFDQATNLFYGPLTIEVDALPRDQLVFPDNVPFYMQHLDKLGLAGLFQVGNQEALFGGGKQTGVRVRSTYRLTEFGEALLWRPALKSPRASASGDENRDEPTKRKCQRHNVEADKSAPFLFLIKNIQSIENSLHSSIGAPGCEQKTGYESEAKLRITFGNDSGDLIFDNSEDIRR